MSKEYDEYLYLHKSNVAAAYTWMRNCLPASIMQDVVDYRNQICDLHDASKTTLAEYNAYDLYFYGGNKSAKVVEDFKFAWLHHIHNNPHHWQYWVLHNDDGPVECLPMPDNYILEMICDWWAFSWSKGDLEEIFSWYDEHKENIMLHPDTREKVEQILSFMKTALWDPDKKNNEPDHGKLKVVKNAYETPEDYSVWKEDEENGSSIQNR